MNSPGLLLDYSHTMVGILYSYCKGCLKSYDHKNGELLRGSVELSINVFGSTPGGFTKGASWLTTPHLSYRTHAYYVAGERGIQQLRLHTPHGRRVVSKRSKNITVRPTHLAVMVAVSQYAINTD